MALEAPELRAKLVALGLDPTGTTPEQLASTALAAIDAAAPVPGSQMSLIQEHPLIRPADEYADLFARSAAHPLSSLVSPATKPTSHHDHE